MNRDANSKIEEEHLWDIDYDKVNEVIKSVKKEGRNTLLENEARKVLDTAGVPIARGEVVHDIDGCIEAARRIGYPVVLKIVSNEIIHKMDVGGVKTDIQNERELLDAYESICSQVRNRKPKAKIQGISVSEQIEEGEEVVIGGMTDQSFGPVVMFGLGGIYIEVMKDVVFRIAPIDSQEAGDMIRDISSFSILIGARGKARKDLNALAEIVSRVSSLMYGVDGIKDIDLNPVAALEEGAVALDVAINIE